MISWRQPTRRPEASHEQRSVEGLGTNADRATSATVALATPGSKQPGEPQGGCSATPRSRASAAITIAVDPSPHHPRSGEAVRDPRVLHPHRHQGAVDQAGARAPDPVGRDSAKRVGGEKSISGRGADPPDRDRGAEERCRAVLVNRPRSRLRWIDSPSSSLSSRDLFVPANSRRHSIADSTRTRFSRFPMFSSIRAAPGLLPNWGSSNLRPCAPAGSFSC